MIESVEILLVRVRSTFLSSVSLVNSGLIHLIRSALQWNEVFD